MGFFSDMWDSACSIASSAFSALSSTFEKIGSTVGQALCSLATKILPALNIISTVVEIVCKVLGIFQKEDKPEDLGAAAWQMVNKGVKPEDFDSINAYIDYLREQIKEGKIDTEPKDAAEAAKYKAMGVSLGIQAVNEKYNLQTSAEFWADMGSKVKTKDNPNGKLDEKELASILETASKNEVKAEDVSSYINGKDTESIKDKGAVSGTIKEALGEANPNLSKDEITDKFNELIKKD